jgi:hypothetical protein
LEGGGGRIACASLDPRVVLNAIIRSFVALSASVGSALGPLWSFEAARTADDKPDALLAAEA